MRARGGQGFTLVEVMVSLAVIGVAAGLIFGVQVRMTGALRDQQNIAEQQQTLRSAAAVIAHDVRQAGYLSVSVAETTLSTGVGTTVLQPVSVQDGASGAPDVLSLQSADDSCQAQVCQDNANKPPCTCDHCTGNPHSSSETEVSDNSCFKNGDLAYAVRVITVGTSGTSSYVPAGTGCLLYITADPQSNASGTNKKIQHNPGQGSPWNQPNNSQCDNIPNSLWGDGYTMFMHIKLRSYRIKPNDARGVLQVCYTGICAESDWQDVALGIIDMQFAMRVYHANADGTSDSAGDLDHDGDDKRDWISGSDMASLVDITGIQNPKILMVSVNLVAKTTKAIGGPALTEVPTLEDTSWPDTAHFDANHNRLSDKGAVTLPVTDTTTWPSSMYVGDVVYRVYTTTIDLRNVGVGIDGHS